MNQQADGIPKNNGDIKFSVIVRIWFSRNVIPTTLSQTCRGLLFSSRCSLVKDMLTSPRNLVGCCQPSRQCWSTVLFQAMNTWTRASPAIIIDTWLTTHICILYFNIWYIYIYDIYIYIYMIWYIYMIYIWYIYIYIWYIYMIWYIYIYMIYIYIYDIYIWWYIYMIYIWYIYIYDKYIYDIYIYDIYINHYYWGSPVIRGL